ncbi:hypothetical protein ABFA07_015483 [Porites harrisoni]
MVGNGKYSCELNNSTHGEHDKDFVEAPNFLYRGTNNPCGSSPCHNNGTCQSGFTKKGYHCLCCGWTGARCQYDIDECDEKSHKCSRNANCTNTKGSYRCKCKTGFHGDGYKCTDIDECQEKRCGTNATCNNTEGSFKCTCNFGYYGDGYNCTECYTIFDFEDHDLSNWTLNGTAFNNQPTYGNNTLSRPDRSWSNHKGDWWIGTGRWIGTYENRSSPSEPPGGEQGDRPQGSMTSPSFQITGKLLTFLIGSGGDKSFPNIRAELIIGGEVVRNKTTKASDEAMKEESWNVTDYAGKNAQLRLVDHSSGDWGHINFDHLQACHKLISDPDS